MPRAPAVTGHEYRSLADVRHAIRQFLAFSEAAARKAGVEPQQHQLLLAIRGLPEGARADVTTLAERLQVRHHSAVELIGRAEAAGFVARAADPADARRVIVRLTRRGGSVLERLSRRHRAKIASLSRRLDAALRTLVRPEARRLDG
ncbi:MAG: MarR family transcriptional regulator [Gemmatimonadaceae bacterium]|nr:MarR family transcriptional regulator [Gemmatimonadaceae bacterium]